MEARRHRAAAARHFRQTRGVERHRHADAARRAGTDLSLCLKNLVSGYARDVDVQPRAVDLLLRRDQAVELCRLAGRKALARDFKLNASDGYRLIIISIALISYNKEKLPQIYYDYI